MKSTIREVIKEHTNQNKIKYFFLLLSLITGIAAGAVFVSALPAEKSSELLKIIKSYLEISTINKIPPLEIFKTSLLQNARIVILIYFCSLSVYLIPIIYINMAARGFVTGFTVGFMALFFGFKGFLVAVVTVLPQIIISIPALLFMSTISMNYAVNGRSKNKIGILTSANKKEFLMFTYCSVIIFLVLLITVTIDAFAVPIFVKLISGVFG